MKRLERKAITLEMNVSRRNLFVLGGGAVTAALLMRPGILHAGSDGFAVKAEPQRGKVKIRDVQSASIADEYVCTLIKITTDSGLFGIGEARCKIPVAKQVNALKELVVGEDPLRVDYLTRKMMAAIKSPSARDIGVIAGIETALWDLAGKILNTPTHNLLGGACRDRIKVYHDLAPADTPKTTEPALWVESAQSAKKGGFKAMKVDIYRGGGDVPEWVQILQAIRTDVGPDMLLGVDFHWCMNSEQTDRFIAMTEGLNLWFIEDPMRYDENLAHYQRVIASGKIPVVALENACADDVIQHEGSLYQDGYLVLNDKPGLGIELNEDYCRKHLSKGSTYFGT